MEWVEISCPAARSQEGLRVDVFLRARFPRRSRSAIQSWIAESRVLCAGRPVKAGRRVRAGEAFVVRFSRRGDPPAQADRLDVIYEDEDILAVNKPGRLLSHPTDKVRQNSATEILKRQSGGAALHLVHRLDRETSGVLLLAKNRETARLLAGEFLGRRVAKSYLAITRGRVGWRRRTADAPLGFAGGEVLVRQGVVPEGAPALTRFIRVLAAESYSLVAARPHTGRLHQIRAHLSWLGHPVLGDKLYQAEGRAYLKMVRGEISGPDLAELGAPRQMLHAWRLRLRHPASGRMIRLEAPPPADFLAALGSLDGNPEIARLLSGKRLPAEKPRQPRSG